MHSTPMTVRTMHYSAQNKENAKLFWSNGLAEKKEQVDELKHCRMGQFGNIMIKETTKCGNRLKI